MKRKLIGCAVLVFVLLVGMKQGFARPGDLDRTFGHRNGIATIMDPNPPNNVKTPYSMAKTAEGKYLLFGLAYTYPDQNLNPFFERYNSDGTLDLTFGRNGRVENLNVAYPPYSNIKLQNNGKILIGSIGSFKRFNADGTLDSTFVPEVDLTTGYTYNTAYRPSVSIQADDKILAIRNFYEDAGLYRFLPTGRLDHMFGENGEGGASLNLGTYEHPEFWPGDIFLLSDGKILISGESYFHGRNYIKKYDATGRLDTTFSSASPIPGLLYENRADNLAPIRGIGVAADGKITKAFSGNQSLTIFRYNSDGTPDTSFGNNGYLRLENTNYEMTLFQLLNDGTMLFAGSIIEPSGRDIYLLRLNNDGSEDNSFGTSGRVSTNVGIYDFVNDWTVSEDQCKLTVLANTTSNPNRLIDTGYGTLLRYQLNDCSIIPQTNTPINITPSPAIAPLPPQITYVLPPKLPPGTSNNPPDPKNTAPLNTQSQSANAPKPAAVLQAAPVQKEPGLVDKVINFFKK